VCVLRHWRFSDQYGSMAAFGKLRHLRNETARINRLIEEEFEQVDAAG